MRKWLLPLVEKYLSNVALLTSNAEDRAVAEQWSAWMKQQWAAYGLPTLKQQRGLMTDVRNAIKQRLGTDHIALETMNFAPMEWVEMNHSITQRAARQNEQQAVLSPETVNAIVTRATHLLMSQEWSEIAAGLVVLTGRQSTEIFKTAQFERMSDFSVRFTGVLKRRGAEKLLSFEIPTLAQAEHVLTAWRRLRMILPTAEMSNEAVNQRYGKDVAKACDQHFADLVQPVEGRGNLYSYLFGKVYATIATYFYCPQNIDAAEFCAEVQGHFSGHEHLTLAERRMIASDRQDRSYVIADADGKIRKGIRLSWQGVSVLKVFDKNKSQPETIDMLEDHVSTTDLTSAAEMLEQLSATPPDKTSSAKSSKTRRAYRKPVIVDFNLLKAVAERIGINAKNRNSEELLNQVLEIFLALGMDAVDSVDPADSQPVEPVQEPIKQAVVESVPKGEAPDVATSAIAPAVNLQVIADQAKTLSWLTQEIETLRNRVQQLEQELRQAQAQPTGQTALKQENERLKQERDAAVEKLEAFRTLLNGNGTHPTPPPADAPSPVVSRRRTATKPAPEKAAQTVISEKPAPSTAPQKPPADKADTDPEKDADLDPGVLRVLYAIIDYNNARTDHADKWAISFPVMKDLCKQIGVATQTKINRVFQAKAALIKQHHQKHELGQRHNRVHQGRTITEVISLAD